MKKDYHTTQPPMHFCGVPVGSSCDDSVDKYTNWVFPKRSTQSDDLVLKMLAKIQCLTPDGAGGQVRTKLALSMHTMRGARGNYLASAIRQKFAEGCDFRVSYGLIGFKTKQILGASTARGRIPLRSTGLDYHPDDDFDLNNDGDDDVILDFYTHQKYFVIQGTYNGVPNYSMVLTGSSNWASLGTAQDEIFFTIQGAGTAKRYLKNFDLMWNSGRFSRNAYTTTYTDFRVARKVRAADGELPHRLHDGAPSGHHDRAGPVRRRRAVLGRRLIHRAASRPAGGLTQPIRPSRATRAGSQPHVASGFDELDRVDGAGQAPAAPVAISRPRAGRRPRR